MGGEIFGWLIDRVSPEQKKAKKYCQKMLELKIIENVEGKSQFSLNDLYRFYFDSKYHAENLLRTWKQEVHEANEVA